MNDNHERILKALSTVPLASTRQLAVLNQSLNPQKKASRLCRELEQEKIIEGSYHGKERIWKLSRNGRKLRNVSPTRLKNITHSLAVGDVYFKLMPKYFLFEPAHKFKHLGEELVWEPDCIYVHDKKVYCCEVQLTPISKKRWERKWRNYNLFFDKDMKHFEKAVFQSLSPNKNIIPRFEVITNQSIETVKTGFNISGRELIIKS